MIFGALILVVVFDNQTIIERGKRHDGRRKYHSRGARNGNHWWEIMKPNAESITQTSTARGEASCALFKQEILYSRLDSSSFSRGRRKRRQKGEKAEKANKKGKLWRRRDCNAPSSKEEVEDRTKEATLIFAEAMKGEGRIEFYIWKSHPQRRGDLINFSPIVFFFLRVKSTRKWRQFTSHHRPHSLPAPFFFAQRANNIA